jgi:hypothetical protein
LNGAVLVDFQAVVMDFQEVLKVLGPVPTHHHDPLLNTESEEGGQLAITLQLKLSLG